MNTRFLRRGSGFRFAEVSRFIRFAFSFEPSRPAAAHRGLRPGFAGRGLLRDLLRGLPRRLLRRDPRLGEGFPGLGLHPVEVALLPAIDEAHAEDGQEEKDLAEHEEAEPLEPKWAEDERPGV